VHVHRLAAGDGVQDDDARLRGLWVGPLPQEPLHPLVAAAVEAEARARGCCKLTLEALEGNTGAIALYRDFGFAAYELDPAMGRASFFEKSLT
jgi:GNAT superfamily N-acetyltransferase